MEPELRKHQKHLFGVTDDQFHIMTDAYSISAKTLEESVELLKDWFNKEPHMPDIELDDHFFEILLGLNKFSVEKTKIKMDNYFAMKSIFPEFFVNRDPWDPQLSKAMDSFDWCFLPILTPDNLRVQIMEIRNPDLYEPEIAAMTTIMIADIKMSLDISCGEIYIWDFKNFRIGNVVKFSPVFVKKAMFIVQNCYGARINSIHILNHPKYAESMTAIFKSVLKKKIGDRIFYHSSLESLHKMVPKTSLPKNYGGEDPRTSDEIADEIKKVAKSPEWRKWYIDSVDIKTDESKRNKDSETHLDDLIGMKGTFRKLDID